MRLKIVLLLLLMFVLVFPFNVKAGVICSDGWESSCLISGPGCCSHHGGVAGGGSHYSNYYDESDDFFSKLYDGEYAGVLTILFFLGLILFGVISCIVESNKNSNNDVVKNKTHGEGNKNSNDDAIENKTHGEDKNEQRHFGIISCIVESDKNSNDDAIENKTQVKDKKEKKR